MKIMEKTIYFKITDAKTMHDEYEHIYTLEQADKTLCELQENNQLTGIKKEYIILRVVVKRYFDENKNFIREEMFTTKVLTNKEIQEVVNTRIDGIFLELQEMLGIKSGDISPEEQMELEQLTSQLTVDMSSLIRKVLVAQE